MAGKRTNGLTPKQKQFADEYLIDLSAIQAAIRAGYSNNSRHCFRMLDNPVIKAYIQKRLKAQQKATIATADEILEYLSRVIRAEEHEDIISRVGNELIESKTAKLTDRTRAAELLAKRYALLTDKIEHTGDVGLNITVKYE